MKALAQVASNLPPPITLNIPRWLTCDVDEEVFPLLMGTIKELKRHIGNGTSDSKFRGYGIEGWVNWEVSSSIVRACADVFGYFEKGGEADEIGDRVVHELEWEEVESFLECRQSYE